jgi:hypothetical protein
MAAICKGNLFGAECGGTAAKARKAGVFLPSKQAMPKFQAKAKGKRQNQGLPGFGHGAFGGKASASRHDGRPFDLARPER